jgi:hypothetical protein
MKTILKSVLMTCLLLAAIQSYSQVKVGIKLGGNLGRMYFDIDRDYGGEFEIKSKMGFHAGLVGDIPILEEKLSVQPSVLYSNKGYSYDLEELIEDMLDDEGVIADIDDVEGYIRMNYNYIEVPINLVYKYKGLELGAGPYIAFGLWGKMRNDFSFEINDEEVESEDVFEEEKYDIDAVWGVVDDDRFEDFFDDEDVIDLFRAFDAGINLSVGYRLNKTLFNVGYSIGLVNMTPVYDADEFDVDEDFTENYIQKNRVFTFSVSTFFR